MRRLQRRRRAAEFADALASAAAHPHPHPHLHPLTHPHRYPHPYAQPRPHPRPRPRLRRPVLRRAVAGAFVLAVGAACAAPLTAAPLLAPQPQQNVAWFRDSDPVRGTGNAFPWGSNGVRYQTIVPGTLLGGVPAVVNDVLVAGHASSMEVVYDDLEIRMGATAQATPAADWNRNNPAPQVVWRGPLRVVFEAGAWRGIGLPRPFNFVPTAAAPNLCFEVVLWASRHPGTNFYSALAGSTTAPGGPIARAFAFQWTSNQSAQPTVLPDGGNKMGLLLDNGNFVAIGHGCRGSTNNVPTIAATSFPRAGQPFDVLLRGALPGSAAALTLGASFTRWDGLPLPADLVLLNAPGCFLWNDMRLAVPVVVDGSGNTRLPVPVPAPTQFGRAYATWVNLDLAANGLGLTTSNMGVLVLGN